MKMPKYVEDMNRQYGKTKTAPTSAKYREGHEHTFGKKPTILHKRIDRRATKLFRCSCGQREITFRSASYEPLPTGYIKHTREKCE